MEGMFSTKLVNIYVPFYKLLKVLVHISAIEYMYIRKGLEIFLENREIPAATRD